MTNASSTYGLAFFLSSWITSQICLVMFFQGISRQRLMIIMDINTSKFTQTPKNASVFPGGVIISPFVPYLLNGKQALFLYHNFGLVVTSAARSLGVPVSQYIDDRHVDQLFSSGLAVHQPCRQLALTAAFILSSLLVSAGYFINLVKSSPLPSTSVRFLGFISDSILQAFLVPLYKKDKFKALREELLGSPSAPVKSLQRFVGKALSFSLSNSAL